MKADLINRACEKALTTPFLWGSADCCTFPCDAVLDATGRDLMESLRGTYHSKLGAARVMKKRHGGGLVETAQHLAREAGLTAARFPWSGLLIGVVASPQGPALALFVHEFWVARSERGVVRLAPHLGLLGWEV